jgi:hypothetical protein
MINLLDVYVRVHLNITCNGGREQRFKWKRVPHTAGVRCFAVNEE